MRKIILILICMILFPLVSASYGTFQIDQPIELIQTCDNGVSICDSCNISNIKDPYSNVVASNLVMTKRVGDFNYTFRNASSLGVYTVTGYCTHTSVYKSWMYHFTIQQASPAENSTTFFIILSISAVVLLLLAFIFKNHIFAIISGFVFSGAGVYGMIYGFGNIVNDYTRIISFVLIGLGAIISITSGFDLMDDTYGGESEQVNDDDF